MFDFSEIYPSCKMHLRCQVHPAFMDPSPDFSQGWVQKTCQKMPSSGGMCESGVHFGCRQLVVSQRGFFLLGIKGHTEARRMLIHQYGTHLAIGWCERYEVSGFSVHYPVQLPYLHPTRSVQDRFVPLRVFAMFKRLQIWMQNLSELAEVDIKQFSSQKIGVFHWVDI